jgi:DNA-binding NarL/FixJ family response regulator
MTIHVLLVEDHKILREGTRELLEQTDDLTVVAESATGEEAITLCGRLQPDVVVMDVRLPGMNGIEVTRAIHHALPNTHILILSAFDEDRYIFPSLEAGASGYLLKTTSITHLADAIRAVHRGETVFDAQISAKLRQRLSKKHTPRPRSMAGELTQRELEVLAGVARGLNNKEIGDELGIAPATVQVHLRSIFAELGVASRTEAVTYAARKGWINLES